MSTRTTYYNLTKPDAGEHVLRTVINQNYDAIDLQMHANAQAAEEAAHISADEYDENTSYIKGDFCIYENTLCKANKNTSGPFTAADWDATTIAAAFEPKHTWELFETITADGNERAYDRQMPTNVTGIFLRINTMQASTASTVGLQVKHTGDTTWDTAASVSNGIVTTEDRYFFIEYSKDGNLWRSTYSQSSAGEGAKTISSRYGTFKITNLALTDIRVIASISGAYFTQNSTIEIYIRR